MMHCEKGQWVVTTTVQTGCGDMGTLIVDESGPGYRCLR